MSLRDLYQEMIVDHGKSPRNFGQITHASHCQSGHNPLCGDRLTIYINEKNGIILDVKFDGSGCAISIASASLMTESLKGKNIADFEKIFSSFHNLVTLGKDDGTLGKLAAFAGVLEFPIRVKCATLAWHTLKAALLNETNPVSTE